MSTLLGREGSAKFTNFVFFGQPNQAKVNCKWTTRKSGFEGHNNSCIKQNIIIPQDMMEDNPGRCKLGAVLSAIITNGSCSVIRMVRGV